MQCIWRRICMIHIHIQEPTQRDNFNINPSAVCLLCSEMLHRIIQIFIDGSSAGALLAAFAFFHVSVELFFLPSFALKTSPVPSTVLLLHPLETRAVKTPISQGLGSHFLPWWLQRYQGAGLHFFATCSTRNGGVFSAFYTKSFWGSWGRGVCLMAPCIQKISYDYARCEVMIRRVLTSPFSCLSHTVSWPCSPALGGCFEAASLHCKKRGFFPTREALRCPEKLLGLRCAWKQGWYNYP